MHCFFALLCTPCLSAAGAFACPPCLYSIPPPGRHRGIKSSRTSTPRMSLGLTHPRTLLFPFRFLLSPYLYQRAHPYLFPLPSLPPYPLPAPPTATLPPAYPTILLRSPLPAPPRHRRFHPSSRLRPCPLPPAQHAQHHHPPPPPAPAPSYPQPYAWRHHLRAHCAP